MLRNLEIVPILVAVNISPDVRFVLCSQSLFSPSPCYRRTALTTCLSCQKPSEPFKKQMHKIWMSPVASKGSCSLAVNHLNWYHRFQSNLETHSLKLAAKPQGLCMWHFLSFECSTLHIPPVGRLWVQGEHWPWAPDSKSANIITSLGVHTLFLTPLSPVFLDPGECSRIIIWGLEL